MKKSFFILASAAILALTMASAPLAQKGKVELGYVEWADATATTNVAKAVLQEKMGYEVEITPVGAAAMWMAVGEGDIDGMTGAWLPVTHGHYFKQVQEDVVDLGPNMEGAKIGLVVPTYVTIASIAEMKGRVEKFDGKIIGIDPGAGIMSKTEQAMEKYGLDDFKLMEGTGAMMTAVLKERIESDEWVVVTGWTPHWKFVRWELKYLADPEGVYGEAEDVHTIVRKGLKEDMPEVYRFLDRFHWEPADVEQVMGWNTEEGVDPYDTAKRWIEENPEKVEEWLK